MVDSVEDWSRVRSAGRAARRRRFGHRQNIRIVQVPRKEAISIDGGSTLLMHPETKRALMAAIDAQPPRPAPDLALYPTFESHMRGEICRAFAMPSWALRPWGTPS